MNSASSGRRLLVRLIGGLRVSDDLPVGGGVAHVGGAPAATRPRQEAKAAADREEETGLMSDLYSGIRAKYSPGLAEVSVSISRLFQSHSLLCY